MRSVTQVGSLALRLMYHLKGSKRTLGAWRSQAGAGSSRSSYRDEAVHAMPIAMADVGSGMISGLCWIVLLVTLTVIVVRRAAVSWVIRALGAWRWWPTVRWTDRVDASR